MGLTDVKIDPAEVLPRRVRNLLGPRSSVASTPAEEGASLDLSLMMLMVFYMTLLLVLHCVPTNIPKKVTGSLPLVATKKKHGMRNLSNECLVTALEAALEKAPQTRKFLEEELPRVSISCQAGFEPGGVHNVLHDARGGPQLCSCL